MSVSIKQGFQRDLVNLAIVELRPTKSLSAQVKHGRKYSQILSSIREVGLIEPPVVAVSQKSQEYLLLDGHLRIMALKELGEDRVSCLVSIDDEGYTYNKYIIRLSAVQEHKMIAKALAAGVSEEKLAKALNIDVRSLRTKKMMLDGICPEAVDLLKDKIISEKVFRVLKKMKPPRQIRVAMLMNDQNRFGYIYGVSSLRTKKMMLDGICPEAVDLLKDKIISEKVFRVLKKMKPPRQIRVAMLMNDQNRFGYIYAKSLLDGTSDDQLVEGAVKKRVSPAALEKRVRLEEENISLGEDVRSLKEAYGSDMLNLTLLQAYLKRLLGNEKVANYLQKYHSVICDKFVEVVQLDFLKIKSTG